MHKSPYHGFSVEFAQHREYVPGDDIRHIDWKVWSKTDRLYIKEYEEETNLKCTILLDASKSMRYGEGPQQKMLYAAQMATTLGHAIVRQSDQVSLSTFDEVLRGTIPPGNSMAQIVRLTEHLDSIEAVQKTRMPECLIELTGRFGRREIVMVFSDFFTDLTALEGALQRMRYNNHEVVLFHVMHHDELAFDFTGQIKFVGLEVPEELLTQPEDLRARYLAAVQRFTKGLDELCQNNRIERIPVDTSRDMAEVLVDYLNQRSLLNRGR
jgi:uncharacterized protein (DUF58 family)